MKFNSLSDIASKTCIIFSDEGLIYSEKILEIFNSTNTNDVLIDRNNPIILNCVGLYFQHIKKNYEMMKKYLMMSIDLGDSDTMCNLGYYYQYIEKDYLQMKKYYLMAIDLGNSYAMCNLGCYYQEIEKDYEMTKKYYLMAIDLSNSSAMCNLGYYYQYIEKDYLQMKKYYLMSIDLGNSIAMGNLSLYYSNDELELYKLLSKISNKNELVKNKLAELENNKIIKTYANKIRIFKKLNNYLQCVLCLESDVLNIDYECGHLICTDCYNPNLKCGLCL